MSEPVSKINEEMISLCRRLNLRIAVAESCTGGLLGARITQLPGVSDIFHGGLIAYDNRVKRQLLGIVDSDLEIHGAVSERVALQMAKGIRLRLGTEIGVSITGIAGPGGGLPEKPVGTVWIGLDIAEGRPPTPRTEELIQVPALQVAHVHHFEGNRDEIREQSVVKAMEAISNTIRGLIS